MTVHFGIDVNDFAEIINAEHTYLDKTLWINYLLFNY